MDRLRNSTRYAIIRYFAALAQNKMGTHMKRNLRWTKVHSAAAALVAVSWVLAVFQGGPLAGTLPILVVVIAGQMLLPGWLIVRLFRLKTHESPIARFAWVMAVGLSVTIILGAGARLFEVPVPLYVHSLHLLMMIGIVLLPETAPRSAPLDRAFWPFYALLALCCVLASLLGAERSTIQIDDWEDQTVFISLADWLAHSPDDPSLLSRQISAEITDSRWRTDGWTYNHAAWVWSSGVSASTLIWHWLTPLFAWACPLAAFALMLELGGRERAAALSAGGVMMAGLLTLDSLVYNTTANAYGQNAFVQLNTLRLFSTALVLPLAYMVCVSYLRQPDKPKLALAFASALALALLHPRQVTLLALGIGLFAMLYWLCKPTRAHLLWSVALLLLIGFTFILPYLQRQWFVDISPDSNAVLNQVDAILEGDEAEIPETVLVLHGLPLLGDTLILKPAEVFYHPLMVIVVALALTMPLWQGSREVSLFVFATTASILIVLLVPGIAALFMRVATARLAPGFILGIPVGMILGVTLDGLLERVPILARRAWLAPVLLAVVLLVLVLEPFPIPASARDQMRAMADAQGMRTRLDADAALIEVLRAQPLALSGERVVYLVPNRVANFVVENIPHALVTGGRQAGNAAGYAGVTRFTFQDGMAPFLDQTDLDELDRRDIRMIALEADSPRVAQMRLLPEQFMQVFSVGGYVGFTVTELAPARALFDRMNALYAEEALPRWDAQGFRLERPVNEDHAQRWLQLAQDFGAADRLIISYGQAFSLMMAGMDENALSIWAMLNTQYPDDVFLLNAYVYTLIALGRADEARPVMESALTSSDPAVRVAAARLALDTPLFSLLSADSVQAVLAAIDSTAEAWELLAEHSREDLVRARAQRLAAAGYRAAADTALSSIPVVEVRSEDLQMRAYMRILDGDMAGALDILRPYLDPDYTAAARRIHADRWMLNRAAGLYHLLRADMAARAGDWGAAQAAYREAVANGLDIAGLTFLARGLAAQGDIAGARATADALADLGDSSTVWADSLYAELEGQPSDSRPRLRSLLDAHAFVDILGVVPAGETTIQVTGVIPPGFRSEAHEQDWEAVVFDLNTFERLGSIRTSPIIVPGALSEWPFDVEHTPVEPFREARLQLYPIDEPQRAPVFSTVFALNTVSANDSAMDQRLDTRFGEHIDLRGYTLESAEPSEIVLRLYWETDAPPGEDYQVFVHVIDSAGELVAQRDSAPVNGHYPTGQWRPGLLIEDIHRVVPPAALLDGTYMVRVGLYRLSDFARLPVAPSGDSMDLLTFTLP